MKISQILLVSFLLTISSCHGQNFRQSNDNNIKVLYLLFDKLKLKDYNKEKLYFDYFFQADKGQPDRTENDKVFYKDTLFKQFHETLNKSNEYNILPLEKAKKLLGKDIVKNDFYYDSQKETIYVLWTTTNKKKYNSVEYFLMDNGKIISLFPYTQDRKLFWWR